MQIVDAKNIFQRTPLHYASEEGHAECVKLLLEDNSDVNAKDDAQITPLHEASENAHLESVKFLLEKNSDVGAKDLFGKFARQYTNNKKCINLLKAN